MKYICPENDCTDWGKENNCPHGVQHDKSENCFLENSICKDCVEVKDE